MPGVVERKSDKVFSFDVDVIICSLIEKMPRQYNPCPPGQQRYEVTSEVMGRGMQMCRALPITDTQAKPGRRTRCFDPTKVNTKRKTCRVLVPHTFPSIAPPSYYFPTELQRRGIEYSCANPNMLLMAPFDGQGDDWTADMSTDHLAIGPMYHEGDGEWQMTCVDPEALLPHGADPPARGESLDRDATHRALAVICYLPTAEECSAIVGRWEAERKWICRSRQQHLFTASALLRGMLTSHCCADELFAPVATIVDGVQSKEAARGLKQLCEALFLMGMYQRKWKGPGTPFPMDEEDTVDAVTPASISPQLRGKRDADLGPLDYIGTASDGAAGVLVNLVRLNGRRAMQLIDDSSWLDTAEAQNAFLELRPVSLHSRALEPRGSTPTRLVHKLLPSPSTSALARLDHLVNRCLNGVECIRMGSARLVLTAMMLHFAAGKSVRNPAWKTQTATQGDPVLLLHNLSNII